MFARIIVRDNLSGYFGTITVQVGRDCVKTALFEIRHVPD